MPSFDFVTNAEDGSFEAPSCHALTQRGPSDGSLSRIFSAIGTFMQMQQRNMSEVQCSRNSQKNVVVPGALLYSDRPAFFPHQSANKPQTGPEKLPLKLSLRTLLPNIYLS